MSEWKSATVAEIAVIKGLVGGPFGSSLVSKDYVAVGVPVIRGVNLASDQKFDGREFVFVSSEKVERELSRNLAAPGDVIFTQRGTLGQVGIVPYGQFDRYVVSQSQMRLRVNREIAEPEFVYYYYKSPEAVAAIKNHAITTGVPHINLGILGAMKVPLPPLRVQRGVCRALSVLDDKIAVNGRIVSHAYDLMRCHYESAIADGTAATTIGTIADVFDGPHATPKKTDSGPWFLSISSLNRGRLLLEESAHLSEQDFAQWTRRVMPQLGDVLFSYETRLGEAALMPAGVRACLGRRMGLLRSRKGQVGPRMLLQAFLSESFQDTIRQRAVHGATVDRIPLTELPSWPITLPARDAERLEHTLGGLDELASYKDRENEVLASLRDALLSRLVSGEIRVRDAEKAVEEAT